MNLIELRPYDQDNAELNIRVVCPICKKDSMTFTINSSDGPWYETLNYMVSQLECNKCDYSTVLTITLI
jgi:C4-type Zn-finger protein